MKSSFFYYNCFYYSLFSLFLFCFCFLHFSGFTLIVRFTWVIRVNCIAIIKRLSQSRGVSMSYMLLNLKRLRVTDTILMTLHFVLFYQKGPDKNRYLRIIINASHKTTKLNYKCIKDTFQESSFAPRPMISLQISKV